MTTKQNRKDKIYRLDADVSRMAMEIARAVTDGMISDIEGEYPKSKAQLIHAYFLARDTMLRIESTLTDLNITF